MNTEAERCSLYQSDDSLLFRQRYQKPRFLLHFQQQYAKIVIDLEATNRRLRQCLNETEKFCSSVEPLILGLSRSYANDHDNRKIRYRCDEHAKQIVDQCYSENLYLRNESTLNLIR